MVLRDLHLLHADSRAPPALAGLAASLAGAVLCFFVGLMVSVVTIAVRVDSAASSTSMSWYDAMAGALAGTSLAIAGELVAFCLALPLAAATLTASTEQLMDSTLYSAPDFRKREVQRSRSGVVNQPRAPPQRADPAVAEAESGMEGAAFRVGLGDESEEGGRRRRRKDEDEDEDEDDQDTVRDEDDSDSAPLMGGADVDDADNHADRASVEVGLLPVTKAVAGWTCCEPLLGVMPTIPALVLLLWFEVWVAAKLSGDFVVVAPGAGSPTPASWWLVFVPVYFVNVLVVAHYVLTMTRGILVGCVILCGIALSLLLPARLSGDIADVSTFVLFIPVWIFALLAFLSVVHVLMEHYRSRGHLTLDRWQLNASWAYLLASVLFTIGMGLLAAAIDAGGGHVWPAPAMVLFASLGLFGGGLFAVTLTHVDEYFAAGGLRGHLLVGAGSEGLAASEDWFMLGAVALRRRKLGDEGGIALARLFGVCALPRPGEDDANLTV